MTSLQEAFTESWNLPLDNSSKLTFYTSVKEQFCWEPYLDSDIIPNFNERRSTSQIRCSSHKLNIELGRYNNTQQQDRVCDYCSSVGTLSPAIETEEHVLNRCPLGSDIRTHFHMRVITLGNTASRPIPDFMTARTLPCEIASDPSAYELKKSLVRLSCRTLHRIYQRTIQFKKDLRDATDGT